jgi:hypothetical protein
MKTIFIPATRAFVEFLFYLYGYGFWCLIFQMFAPLFAVYATVDGLCWFNRPRLNRNVWHFSRLALVQNVPYRAKHPVQSTKLNQPRV